MGSSVGAGVLCGWSIHSASQFLTSRSQKLSFLPFLWTVLTIFFLVVFSQLVVAAWKDAKGRIWVHVRKLCLVGNACCRGRTAAEHGPVLQKCAWRHLACPTGHQVVPASHCSMGSRSDARSWGPEEIWGEHFNQHDLGTRLNGRELWSLLGMCKLAGGPGGAGSGDFHSRTAS